MIKNILILLAWVPFMFSFADLCLFNFEIEEPIIMKIALTFLCLNLAVATK